MVCIDYIIAGAWTKQWVTGFNDVGAEFLR